MNNLDFEYDHDDFQRDLARAARNFKRAQENFYSKAEYWSELGPKFFGGMITIKTEAGNIIGQVAGKNFAIAVMPLTNETGSYALASVSIPNLYDEFRTEVVRFLVDENGGVTGDGGAKLLSNEDETPDYRLLAAIVRRVLAAEPKG